MFRWVTARAGGVGLPCITSEKAVYYRCSSVVWRGFIGARLVATLSLMGVFLHE